MKFNILKELWYNFFKDFINKCVLDNKSVIWVKIGGKKIFFFLVDFYMLEVFLKDEMLFFDFLIYSMCDVMFEKKLN